MPNQRGNYSADPSSPGWVKWILGGAAAGTAVLVGRWFLREGQSFNKEVREYKSRHPGLKPGMSRAEQDAYWDAYYAKHGYPFDLPAEYRK
jgi:hypothetical protein